MLTSTELNSTEVASADSIVMAAPGSYSVTAKATNLGGVETDTNTVTIIVQTDPPPVVINAPTLNRIYSHRFGTPATIVPFAFTATSSFGGIVTLSAKVDGANVGFTPAGLGTATADANFTVNVIAPPSTVMINQPLSSWAAFPGAGRRRRRARAHSRG